MVQHIALKPIDLAIFIIYMFLAVGLGFFVSFRKKKTTRGYFLGGKSLPWFVIACSMLASDISSEHFIANSGIGYRYGIVGAMGGWQAWISYTIFIWIFIPYYLRTNLYTIPEFLERRYSPFCRYIFSASLVIGYVFAIIAGTLYAGGITFERTIGPFLGREFSDPHTQIVTGIIFFGALTGTYTIYGGLRSAAWTDFMQIIVLGVGGVLVPVLGLVAVHKMGGIMHFFHQNPSHFQIFLPVDHPRFPVTGVMTGFLTVGIWYTCTSQHIVQRVLAAKNEWHARMGVVGAGLLHTITPFFFVVPGILAFKLLPNLHNPDTAYLTLVEKLLGPGLRGLILAAMAAALMSNLSAVLNSASTLVTIDFYKRLIHPKSTESQEVRFGQISGALILGAGAAIAWYFSLTPDVPLFLKVQNVFYFIAPPFSVVFLAGLLWRRANTPGALATIILGFAVTPVLGSYMPGVYLHRAIIAWFICATVMVLASLFLKNLPQWLASLGGLSASLEPEAQLAQVAVAREGNAAIADPPPSGNRGGFLPMLVAATTTPPRRQIDTIIWTPKYARLPEDERRRYHGIKDWRIWWALFVGIIMCIFAFFLWNRIQHPVEMWNWSRAFK